MRPGRRVPPDRRRGIRGILGLSLVLLAIRTAGCATMRGLGEDIQFLGRGIKKASAEL